MSRMFINPFMTIPSSITAFGARYSNPSTLGTSGAYDLVFNKSSSALGYVTASSSSIPVYAWSGSGFGSKYAEPSTTITYANSESSIAFTDNEQYIAATGNAGGNSPFIYIWPWSNSTGFGTKLANPSPALFSNSNGDTNVSFAYGNNYVAYGAKVSSGYGLAVFVFSAGFSTKYSNPSTTTTNVYDVEFSHNDSVIAIVTGSLQVYPWSSSGFGSKFSDPSTSIVSTTANVAFNSTDTAIAVTSSGTPTIQVYAWSNSTGFGSKFSDPSSNTRSDGRGVDFIANNTAIGQSGGGSPFISVWQWSNSGFGTSFADPINAPTTITYALRFANNNNSIGVVNATSPYIYVWPWNP